MAEKEKVETDTTPSSMDGMGVSTQWSRNQHKSRATVLTKTSRGAPPPIPKFDGMCDDLKGRSLIFNSEYPLMDVFTHV